MELGLAGKTAIVTGGGSNIGRAITLALAGEGSNVVIADMDESAAGKVAENAKDLPGKIIPVKTDITDFVQVQEMVKRAVTEFKQIDILVNNAGWGYDKLFIEQSKEEWEKIIAINYWGVIYCTRAVLDYMIEQKSGCIVSTGSDAGRIGEYAEAVYAGCKAGVIAFSKATAREVGRYGIRLNVVCPGMTPPGSPEDVGEQSLWKNAEISSHFTPDFLEKAAKRYPLRRLGTPQDIARAMVFLASDAASFITGQTLSVSGGYTMI